MQQSSRCVEGNEEFDHIYHSKCYEDRRDLEGARRALADFEKNGGTTLEELKRELNIEN
jgi:hypothetical protein